MEMYGAHIHLVSKEEDGFKKVLEIAEVFAEEIVAYRDHNPNFKLYALEPSIFSIFNGN